PGRVGPEPGERRQSHAAGRHAGRGLHPDRRAHHLRLPDGTGDRLSAPRDARAALMRFLFVHQNFPGQYRHLAAHLARAGHEVVAIGETANLHRTPRLAGVKLYGYEAPPTAPNGFTAAVERAV